MAENIIAKFFDRNTFVATENHIVSEAGVPGDGVVTGYGAVSGRLVYAASYDSTVLGGAFGAVQAGKISRTVSLAARNGAPFILFIDSNGVKLEDGVLAISGFGKIASSLTAASNVIPLISAVTGNCFGTMSIIASLFDFVVMNKENGTMSLNTELVINSKNGFKEEVKNFGGADFCGNSGSASVVTENEDEMVSAIRNILSLLPDNNKSGAPSFESADDENRFNSFGEIKAGMDVIKEVADSDMPLIELQKEFGEGAACALGVAGGITTGFVAAGYGDGYVNGKALTKVSSFVEFCDSFNIPVVTFVDAQGFKADFDEERNQISAKAAGVLGAYCEAYVPKVTIVTGRAYGGAYVSFSSKSTGADYVAAWTKSDISSISPEASVEVIYHDEIASSSNPDLVREEKLKEYKAVYSGPEAAASKGEIDEIIDPGETRAFVISGLNMLSGKNFFSGRTK